MGGSSTGMPPLPVLVSPTPFPPFHLPLLIALSRRVSTLDQMRELVPTFRNAFNTDEETFKRVYKYTFNFARTGNQKGLSLEVAVEYWKLLLADRFGGHLDTWVEFLENVYKRSINKDTWNCMYDFVVLARGDPTLQSYDVDGRWRVRGGG